MFDFNVSLNKFAPVSPMLLSVDLRMEKSGLLMDAICVLFLLSSPPRLSSVSVVFDFNASLNGVAPVFPMLFADDLVRMEKCGLSNDIVCCFFRTHSSDGAELVLSLISMHHSMMLLLCLQCSFLLIL